MTALRGRRLQQLDLSLHLNLLLHITNRKAYVERLRQRDEDVDSRQHVVFKSLLFY